MKQLEIQAILTIHDYNQETINTLNTLYAEIRSKSFAQNVPNNPDFTDIFKLINQAKDNIQRSLVWSNAIKIDIDAE